MRMKRAIRAVAFAAGCVALCACAASARPSQSASSTASSASIPAKKPASKRRHHYVRRQPMQKAPAPDRISEIQSALARNGYYQGNANGKWDSSTVAAMQKFQSDHGLDATGKLDALSLQKLGLGSDIAGVSAPRPITPTTTAPPATQMPPAPKPQPSGPAAPVSSNATASASLSVAKPQR